MLMCVSSSVLCMTLCWIIAHQAPLSRQAYLSGLPFPSSGDLPGQGIKPGSSAFYNYGSRKAMDEIFNALKEKAC